MITTSEEVTNIQYSPVAGQLDMTDSNCNFEPGGAKLGNFINYYRFNPAQTRIRLLPSHLWISRPNEEFLCLDVGCNTGELTQALFSFLLPHINAEKLQFLGIDLDPVLVERANELNNNPSIRFSCADALNFCSGRDINSFLITHNKEQFDVAFLFSVTMWIHLNHGDSGLRLFLKAIASKTEMLVLEPQPWKCYKSAVRRMKKLRLEPFPFWGEVRACKSIESNIEDILVEECNFVKIFETEMTSWGRRIIFFKKVLHWV